MAPSLPVLLLLSVNRTPAAVLSSEAFTPLLSLALLMASRIADSEAPAGSMVTVNDSVPTAIASLPLPTSVLLLA